MTVLVAEAMEAENARWRCACPQLERHWQRQTRGAQTVAAKAEATTVAAVAMAVLVVAAKKVAIAGRGMC